MKIGNFSIWTSAKEAASFGATHHARLYGIVPGFVCDGFELLWVPRTDALNWLEDLLSFGAALIQQGKGEEPLFGFTIGKAIKLPK